MFYSKLACQLTSIRYAVLTKARWADGHTTKIICALKYACAPATSGQSGWSFVKKCVSESGQMATVYDRQNRKRTNKPCRDNTSVKQIGLHQIGLGGPLESSG